MPNSPLPRPLRPGTIKPLSHCLRNQTWLSNKATSWTKDAVKLEVAQAMWASVDWARSTPLR
jgi:hypothetical protein